MEIWNKEEIIKTMTPSIVEGVEKGFDIENNWFIKIIKEFSDFYNTPLGKNLVDGLVKRIIPTNPLNYVEDNYNKEKGEIKMIHNNEINDIEKVEKYLEKIKTLKPEMTVSELYDQLIKVKPVITGLMEAGIPMEKITEMIEGGKVKNE